MAPWSEGLTWCWLGTALQRNTGKKNWQDSLCSCLHPPLVCRYQLDTSGTMLLQSLPHTCNPVYWRKVEVRWCCPGIFRGVLMQWRRSDFQGIHSMRTVRLCSCTYLQRRLCIQWCCWLHSIQDCSHSLAGSTIHLVIACGLGILPAVLTPLSRSGLQGNLCICWVLTLACSIPFHTLCSC